ncbi:MAG TPA: GNAT family N-acetyltransferase [Thermoanaerobaculia bacterium]
MTDYPLADLALSRRLERCEGRANAAFVEARARIAPEIGAQWIERAGALAMFDGAGSPLTQTFALGVTATPTADDLEAIETFFAERGADVFHEVSPMAGPETLALLVARGYRPVELTSVMYQPIGGFVARGGAETRVRARLAGAHELEAWASCVVEGWSEFVELGPMMRDMAAVSATARGTHVFFAEREGRPIGTGALTIQEGVALLAGASTIPAERNQGAQRALLETRLQYAAAQGCDLAMMCAAPGSASQRNAERQGFRIAYTRIKWGRDANREQLQSPHA